MNTILSAHYLPGNESRDLVTVTGLGVHSTGSKVFLYFRWEQNGRAELRRAVSRDGLNFSLDKARPEIKEDGQTVAVESLRSLTFSEAHGLYILSYLCKTASGNLVTCEAWSEDGVVWRRRHKTAEFTEPIHIIPNYRHHRKHTLYSGKGAIFRASSSDLKSWEKKGNVLEPREDNFDNGALSTAFVKLTAKGILMLYDSVKAGKVSIGVALIDRSDPCKVLWRCDAPIWTTPLGWGDRGRLVGVALSQGRLVGYWQVQGDGLFAVVYGLYKLSDGHSSKDISLSLARAPQNPLISPNPRNSWEAFTTFNPAAVYAGGQIHLLYRAQGYDYVSVIGHAASSDGVHIDSRDSEPAFLPSGPVEYTGENKPRTFFPLYMSGGGYGGAEDPRATIIGDRLYMTYVAYDGVTPPRIALTSIALKHFLNKRWLWEKPVLISPPGVVDKSAVIFPEKIHGKYAILHRIYPNILLDYVDSLKFDGATWLKGEFKITPRPGKWDSRKIGAGAPPIKTDFGWLLIYQSVGEQDPSKYKVGAMLLDLDDPSIVLYRSQSPILEPEASYENDGFKAGVIYPCGATVIGKTLYVYYGGADSHVCVATANLNDFLRELRHSEVARLTTPITEKLF